MNASAVKENLLRCEGRIQHAPLACDSKTPILLNDKHKLSQLIVKNIHECYKHIGLKHTELRQGFRIVRGRNLGVQRKYLVCKRFERKTYHYPITPPLTPLVDL